VRDNELTARWETWDGVITETLRLGWESGGWTADGVLDAPEPVQYAVRLDPHWKVRQLLVFRDLDEPDLWLGHDGGGRWGEINGAHRPDLDGCVDVELSCTPFTVTLPVRRLGLPEGGQADVVVLYVDVDTLLTERRRRRYTRLEGRRWRCEALDTGEVVELEVDDDGLVLDHPSAFRRLPAPR
jgi:hypothetical protein